MSVSNHCYSTTAQIVIVLASVLFFGLSASLAQSPHTPLASPNAPFRDCPECPEMIAIPPGSFLMGSTFNVPDFFDDDDELPQRSVTIGGFAAGRYEVTNAEWQACVAESVCRAPSEPASQTMARFPVTGVSWDDAGEYTNWLSAHTGRRYRLLSEAEWEYSARAGSSSQYWWGDLPDQAYSSYYDHIRQTQLGPEITDVGSYPGNPFGLFDTAGNVLEWVEDCYAPSLAEVPTDGSAFESQNCRQRSVRGSWGRSSALGLRTSTRFGMVHELRDNTSVGFRVARELD